MTAMHLIGAGKTTLLSASAPIFLLPMSVLLVLALIGGIAGVLIGVGGGNNQNFELLAVGDGPAGDPGADHQSQDFDGSANERYHQRDP